MLSSIHASDSFIAQEEEEDRGVRGGGRGSVVVVIVLIEVLSACGVEVVTRECVIVGVVGIDCVLLFVALLECIALTTEVDNDCVVCLQDSSSLSS